MGLGAKRKMRVSYSALLNADKARQCGGRLLVRIEDIDTARCRAEYETAIYEDL